MIQPHHQNAGTRGGEGERESPGLLLGCLAQKMFIAPFKASGAQPDEPCDPPTPVHKGVKASRVASQERCGWQASKPAAGADGRGGVGTTGLKSKSPHLVSKQYC